MRVYVLLCALCILLCNAYISHGCQKVQQAGLHAFSLTDQTQKEQEQV